MSITIPSQEKRIVQVGNSDVLGNMWSSFNLDLTSKQGVIKVSPRTIITTDDIDNLEVPLAFKKLGDGVQTHDGIYTISKYRIFENTTQELPDAFVVDANAPTVTLGGDGWEANNSNPDLEVFNDRIYAHGQSLLYRLDPGSGWASVTDSALDVGGRGSLLAYASRLYMVHGSSKVGSMNKSQTVIGTGSNTLDLSDFGGAASNIITKLLGGTNRIWILTINTNHGNGRIYEWDGEAENDPSRSYILESFGALAGVIMNDIPYIMDVDGRLLAFNGGSFQEIARLPIENLQFLKNPLSLTASDRFLHPNGMTVVNGRIQILINNERNNNSGTIEDNCPSGIWEYSPETGLYHKYSLSQWVSGDSTATDYGQIRMNSVGALEAFKTTDTESDKNGKFLAGGIYNATNTTTKSAIWIDDTNDTIVKAGYLVSTWGESSQIKDSWKAIYIANRKLLNSTDKIVCKWRDNEEETISATVGFLTERRFTTTEDLTDKIGWEVEVVQGGGSGASAHIKSVTGTGTFTVTLDEDIAGASDDTKVRIMNFKKSGTITSQTDDVSELPIGVQSHRLQVKVLMFFTGKNEVHSIMVPSGVHQGTK